MATTESGTARTVQAHGHQLAVRAIGGGHPTLVLHGGGPGCSSTSDFAAAAPLLARGRELFLVDLVQYGDSEATRIEGPMFDFHAATIAALLEQLRLSRVDVIAQSLGGSVALRLAAQRPDLVRRIVATGCQPTPFATADDPRVGLGARARERYYGGGGPTQDKMRELITTLEWHDGSQVPDRLVAERFAASVGDAGRRFGPDPTARGNPQDLAEVMGAVQAPVLLVWGAHDPFSDAEYAAGLVRWLPRAHLRVIDDAAHHAQSERPEQYAGLVTAFLDDDEETAE